MADVKLELNDNGCLAETNNGRKIINDYEYKLNHKEYKQFIGGTSQTVQAGDAFNISFAKADNFTFKPSWHYFDTNQTFGNNISSCGMDEYQIGGGTDLESKSEIQQKISEIISNTNQTIANFNNSINQKLYQNFEIMENTNLLVTSASHIGISPQEIFGVENITRKIMLLDIFEMFNELFANLKESVCQIGQILNENYYPVANLLLADKGLVAETFANPKNPDNSPSAKLWMTADTKFDKEDMPAIYLMAQTAENIQDNHFIDNTKADLVIMPNQITITSTNQTQCSHSDRPLNTGTSIIVNGQESQIILEVQHTAPNSNQNLNTEQITINESGIRAIGSAVELHSVNFEETASSSIILNTDAIAVFCNDSTKTPSGIEISNDSLSIFQESNRILHIYNDDVSVNGNLSVRNGTLTNHALNNYANNEAIFMISRQIHNKILNSRANIQLSKESFLNSKAVTEQYNITEPISESFMPGSSE